MTTQQDKWSKIAGYLAKEMNEEQEKEFLLDMQDNQLLKNDYDLMMKTWKQFDENPEEKYMDSSAAWNALKNKISKDGLLNEEELQYRITGRQQFLRIAAVIVMILAVGVPSLYFAIQKAPATASIEHSSVDGVLTVDLPDGSRVFLNKGAKLNYKRSFEEKREVNLRGEGYFDVMSNPKKPFNVNTGRVVVTVLGTSFNIKESKDREVEVYVESGSVQVSMDEIKESIILKPGQLGTASEILETSAQENANYLSWKTKDFKFVDESIEDILKVLTSSYHVEVVTDNISLQGKRLTTAYNDQSFDAILSTICLAHNLDYEKEGKVYILQSN